MNNHLSIIISKMNKFNLIIIFIVLLHFDAIGQSFKQLNAALDKCNCLQPNKKRLFVHKELPTYRTYKMVRKRLYDSGEFSFYKSRDTLYSLEHILSESSILTAMYWNRDDTLVNPIGYYDKRPFSQEIINLVVKWDPTTLKEKGKAPDLDAYYPIYASRIILANGNVSVDCVEFYSFEK